MRRFLLAAAAALSLTGAAFAEAVVGEAAPAFTGTDSNGVTHNLSDFAGKTVVLEWTNHLCPYVKKHYGAGNMQKLQGAAAADGVVWLSIVSSAEGKQGFVTPEEANAIATEGGSKATAKLLDPTGMIGKAYGAKTTPHMYVIDGTGKLVYAGAIDSNSSADPKTIEGATNYVAEALAAVKAGTSVATPETEAYGCSVKYGS
jgi:peroxiredoxin